MIITRYAIKFRVAVFVMTALMAVAGTWAYLGLPREGTPDITIPYVFVVAPYEGTAPEDVEKLITKPLEKQINNVEGIKEIRSVSAEGLSQVVVEFLAGEDIDKAKQRVRDRIDLAKPDLPHDLDEPIVDAFNFSADFPVLTLALSGDVGVEALKHVADDMQDRIDDVAGVREVGISGAREREIRVEVDLARMVSYGVPMGVMLGRIASENRTLSAGNIEVRGSKFQVRVPGEFALASDLRHLLLLERGGRPVYLSDVAVVNDTFKDPTTISRLNGKPCVSLTVKKRSGINTVSIVRSVRKVLDEITLPAGVSLTTVMDQSEYVDEMVGELENNLFSGFALVFIILLVFMGVRNSMFVALAMPLSMMIAFAVMAVMGTTLNMVVLFSLVMGVGMLVDNAIVIVENIYRHRMEGMSRTEAALIGAQEVAWPITTSTITTLVAFAPLLFWPDVMGQFMWFMPWTLIVVLTASLFVALVINPAVCSVIVGKSGKDIHAEDNVVLRGYERILRGALAHRGLIISIAFMFLFASMAAYALWGKGVELFPEVEPRNATVEVRLPQGAPIAKTDGILRRIESGLGGYEDVKFFLASAGAIGQLFSASSGDHVGMIHIEFKKKEARKGNSLELVNRIRADIGQIPGAEIRVKREEEGPPVGADVSIELAGEEFDTLRQLSGELKRRIETVPGLVDLQDDFEEAMPELRFRVDRARAATLGLDTATIGSFLRMAIYGMEASKIRTLDEEYEITLRLPESQRSSAAALSRMRIPLANGESVALSSVGEIVYTGGRGAITRKDQKRMVTISGSAAAGRGATEILDEVKLRLSTFKLPRGYTLAYGGKDKEMNQSSAFLGKAFLVAIGLIFLTLVMEFNSVLLPAIIMFSILLSLIGVYWGLILCGMRFGIIMTGVGVISLAGVVVNNAIVLIDCTLQLREEGLSAVEAAVRAGRLRLRPVFLTAITTVLGLIPMAMGFGVDVRVWPPKFVTGAESSAWWGPMAIVVIFGLSFATVLTLVIVPAMYCSMDQLKGRLKRRWGNAESG